MKTLKEEDDDVVGELISHKTDEEQKSSSSPSTSSSSGKLSRGVSIDSRRSSDSQSYPLRGGNWSTRSRYMVN